MKKLPSVTAFKIEKKLDNYQERFYSKEEDRQNKKVNVIKKINDIFASSTHVYKSKVRIYTNNDILQKTIVGKSNVDLLTIDGEKIKIYDIVDIEKI